MCVCAVKMIVECATTLLSFLCSKYTSLPLEKQPHRWRWVQLACLHVYCIGTMCSAYLPMQCLYARHQCLAVGDCDTCALLPIVRIGQRQCHTEEAALFIHCSSEAQQIH